MNNLDILLNHRTIRKWKDKVIDESIMEKLFEAANRASTSNGMQNASIIRIKDPLKRKAISELARQKYLEEAPELLIFIVDNYRNYKIVEEQAGESNFANDGDRFFQGYTDGVIMAQTIAVGAESLGLGIVYFGSILNNIRELIKILDLPENTFPVVGMGIGYPDQEPTLKPRISINKKVFVDSYDKKKNYMDELKDYDEEMKDYYDLRNPDKPMPAYTEQVLQKNSARFERRSEIFKIIKEQGFNIGL